MQETENQEPTTINQQKRFYCRHIFTGGHRCGSSALRGEDFCYYHHTTRRPSDHKRGVRNPHTPRPALGLRAPPPRSPPDRAAIQASIGLVLRRRIAANQDRRPPQ